MRGFQLYKEAHKEVQNFQRVPKMPQNTSDKKSSVQSLVSRKLKMAVT